MSALPTQSAPITDGDVVGIETVELLDIFYNGLIVQFRQVF